MIRFSLISTFVLGLAMLSSCQSNKQGAVDPNIEINFDAPAAQPKTTPSQTITPVKVGPQANVDSLPVYQGAGKRVSSVNVSGKYVALTFDDGPHATYTPLILDILKKYNAKATFYVLGQNVKRYPSVVARTIAEGSEIGSHSWDHPLFTKLGASGVREQLDKTNAAIAAASPNYKPRTFRPPYGGVNANLVNFFAHDYGMSTIMWSVDTNDWRKPGVQTVINRAVNGARPGSIILLHDIHGTSYQAVEGIVTGLIARGFTLVTVSQLMAMQQTAPTQPATAPGVAPSVAPAPVPAPVPVPVPAPVASTPVVPTLEPAPVNHF